MSPLWILAGIGLAIVLLFGLRWLATREFVDVSNEQENRD